MFAANKHNPKRHESNQGWRTRGWLWVGMFVVALTATPALADQDGDSNNWFTDLFKVSTDKKKPEEAAKATPAPEKAAEDSAKTEKAAEDSTKTEVEAKDDDPLEGYNRFMHGFNQIIRDAILDPLVDGYQAITPDPVEKAISNIAKNLNEPITAGSSLLQGDTENAKKATQRFLINTTVGLGGAKDVAKEEYGIKSRQEDLGQAAGKGGAEAGAHIVLPILGPSNTRDALGTAATALINPIGAIGSAAQGAVEYSDNQDVIKDVSKGALDPYVVERDAYEQHREYQIRNAAPPAKEADFPGLNEEPVK